MEENLIEKINHLQDYFLHFIIKLQKIKSNIQVYYVENPFYKFKNKKQVEEFLKTKATRFMISGPKVWLSLGLKTELSPVYDWIYNDGIDGIFEVENEIYYFKKIEFPNEITIDFLIQDCKKYKLLE